jgi:hypothetical protein
MNLKEFATASPALQELHQVLKLYSTPQPALKLINWSKLVGCETSKGTLLGFDVNNNASVVRMIGVFPKCMIVPTDTIKLAEQTKFTHLPVGTKPPVIEGLVIEYEYWISMSGTSVRKYEKDYTRIPDSMWVVISAYRVVGIDRANGWTDDPEEAK